MDSDSTAWKIQFAVAGFFHSQSKRQGLETPNVLRAPSVMRPAADLVFWIVHGFSSEVFRST